MSSAVHGACAVGSGPRTRSWCRSSRRRACSSQGSSQCWFPWWADNSMTPVDVCWQERTSQNRCPCKFGSSTLAFNNNILENQLLTSPSIVCFTLCFYAHGWLIWRATPRSWYSWRRYYLAYRLFARCTEARIADSIWMWLGQCTGHVDLLNPLLASSVLVVLSIVANEAKPIADSSSEHSLVVTSVSPLVQFISYIADCIGW